MKISSFPLAAVLTAGIISLPILFNTQTDAAGADDGGISFGGSPTLLKGHASVAMKNEVVTMNIGKEEINVDCRFLFHNDGADSTVRVGFPDTGEGSMEPYQGEDKIPTGKDLQATFLAYDSWVDGKKVATQLVPTKDRSLYWHAKTVLFKGGKDCQIRDTYRLLPGGQVTSDNGVYQLTYYVLHTGSSWKGPIGKATIIVNFAPDVIQAPIKLRSRSSFKVKSLDEIKWATLPKGTVIYEGPCQPKLTGNTLTFTANNLKPSAKDDIHLYYNYKKVENN